jgi:adenylate cyclase
MKAINFIFLEKERILRLMLYGALMGFFYSFVEYYLSDVELLPLIIRATVTSSLIFGSIGLLEILMQDSFRKISFLLVSFLKTILYFFIIIFWLTLINGIYESFFLGESFINGVTIYYQYSGMFVNNVLTILFILLLTNVFIQINSLHRKGELISFILGRYHTPTEQERLFLFLDLKSSTMIAEQLGHFRFGAFMQEYYYDISKAVKTTGGQVYDYIGDEIIISWRFGRSENLNQMGHCVNRIREILLSKVEWYQRNFNYVPYFKAGAHGGKVVVLWVGNEKKEILYLGDVLNTTKRIQSECDRLGTDFLISGDLVSLFKEKKFSFEMRDTLRPRGKTGTVELFSVSG